MEYDFLAARQTNDLSVAEVLNLLALTRIRKRSDVAIVSSVRDDGVFLLEWIAHYRAIGIRDFYLYSNSNLDGSEELLQSLDAAGVIKFIANDMAEGVHPQRKVYAYSLNFLSELREFEWVLF